MFLQPHLFLFNEEYKFRVKYNTVNFQQKDPSLKYACGWFIYEFLHRMIILKESFNKATDFINPKIESFFTNMWYRCSKSSKLNNTMMKKRIQYSNTLFSYICKILIKMITVVTIFFRCKVKANQVLYWIL